MFGSSQPPRQVAQWPQPVSIAEGDAHAVVPDPTECSYVSNIQSSRRRVPGEMSLPVSPAQGSSFAKREHHAAWQRANRQRAGDANRASRAPRLGFPFPLQLQTFTRCSIGWPSAPTPQGARRPLSSSDTLRLHRGFPIGCRVEMPAPAVTAAPPREQRPAAVRQLLPELLPAPTHCPPVLHLCFSPLCIFLPCRLQRIVTTVEYTPAHLMRAVMVPVAVGAAR